MVGSTQYDKLLPLKRGSNFFEIFVNIRGCLVSVYIFEIRFYHKSTSICADVIQKENKNYAKEQGYCIAE